VLLETFPEYLLVRRALLFGLQEESQASWRAWKALLPDLAPQAGLIRTPLGQMSL
jgi:hypothetical protein